MKNFKKTYASALRSIAQIFMFAGAMVVATVAVGAEKACATGSFVVQDKKADSDRELMLQLHRLGMPVPTEEAPKS